MLECSVVLIPYLEMMLFDFQQERLEVCLVPNKDGEKENDGRHIRATYSKNIFWYRELCALYPDSRQRGAKKKKPRTIIKRKNIEEVLNTLIEKQKSTSKYAPFILNVAENYKRIFEDQDVPF